MSHKSNNFVIPEIVTLRQELPLFIAEAKERRSQPAKELLFASFVQKVFKIHPEDFGEKMEVPVESKVLLMKGRIDTLFGNLIIEFKVDLDRELDDAKREIAKYFQAMHEKFPKSSFLGMATDDLKFKVYKANIDLSGKVSGIVETDSIDLEKERDVERIFLWFDSYLFVSEKIPPTTEDLRKRFGVESPSFSFLKDELENMYESVKNDPTVKIKYSIWEKHLEIVYGEQIASSSLFIKHTYLATLAKVIVYLHLYKSRLPKQEEITYIVNGKKFEDYGIDNFIEEDFFAWILQNKIAAKINDFVMKLLKQLSVYDLTLLNEDVFKELYQELVDPELRHDLGEYYTPDWLAELMVNSIIDRRPSVSILDPSCGSGTFLFSSVNEVAKVLTKKGWQPTKILAHILNNIMGMDIHPLAVIIARTNYLLALRELLEYRTGAISLPVYMCDSIKLPEFTIEVHRNVPVYRIDADGKGLFFIPQTLADKPFILDQTISKMYESSKNYEEGRQSKSEAITSFVKSLNALGQGVTHGDGEVLEENFKTLLQLIDKKANSIWTFILRNIYKPISLSHRKFDCIVGNPPWITFKFMKNKLYRDFLISESSKNLLTTSLASNQLPNMELATLFFKECSSLYLNTNGIIDFVMPKSILVSEQHKDFRMWDRHHVEPLEILDLEEVNPLFNVPACVLKARKMQ